MIKLTDYSNINNSILISDPLWYPSEDITKLDLDSITIVSIKNTETINGKYFHNCYFFYNHDSELLLKNVQINIDEEFISERETVFLLESHEYQDLIKILFEGKI